MISLIVTVTELTVRMVVTPLTWAQECTDCSTVLKPEKGQNEQIDFTG